MSNLIREQFQAMINQQVTSSLTDDLLSLFDLDDAMPNMLEILNDPDQRMRKYGAVNLRLVVEKQWEAIEDNGSAETYLNQFLQFLQKETDNNIIDNFMHSIETVLEKYGSMWMDLFNFAFEISQTRTVAALIILVYATHTVENDFICQIADSIVQLVTQAATTITDKKGKVRAFQLFAEAFDRDEPLFQPYPDSFLQIFNLMMETYVNDLKNPGQSMAQAEQIVNLESDVISTVLRWNYPFVDFCQTYEYLLQLLQDETIPSDIIYSLFDPIQSIIETHGNIIREYLPTTLELFLNYSAAKCVEGSFIDQSLNIGDVVDALSCHMLPSDFIKYITEYRLKASTFGEHYAWMLILNHACPNIMDEIQMHVNEIIQPLLDILEEGNESLAQISMLTMYSMIDVCERAAEGYTNKILESVLAYKDGELEGTVIAMCQVISVLFSYHMAETDIVIEVVGIILQSFETRSDATERKYMMEVFNMAIQSCESACSQFDESVFHLIDHYAQTTEQEEIAIRPDALEAVGSFVTFYPDLSEEQLEFYINLLINNLCEADDIDNLNSVSRALSTIIKNRKEAINLLVATSILMSLMAVIDALYKNYVSQDFPESELARNQITTVGSFIRLETRILKSFKDDFLAINDESSDEEKEILKSFLTNVTSLVIQFQQYSNESYLLQYLLNLGIPIFEIPIEQLENNKLSREDFIKEYMLKLMSCFPEDDKDNVMSALINATKIVKKRQNSQEEFPFNQYIPELYDYAIKACNRELPVLEEIDDKFKYDPDIVYHAHNLISNIILYCPDIVDLSAFLNYVVNAIDKLGDYEICELFSPLASYPHCIESIPDEILDLAVKSLNYCDFSHPPNPIYFFLELTEEKPQLMNAFLQQYPQFIELLFNILTKDDNRERYYAETIANSASLILSLTNKIGQVPIDQFLPHIVNKLPYKRDTIEGKKIALWAVDLIQNNKMQIDKSVEFEILRGLILQMAMNDSELEKYEFNDEERNRIIHVIMSLSKINPDFIPTIFENIGDAKKMLFQKHTNIEF